MFYVLSLQSDMQQHFEKQLILEFGSNYEVCMSVLCLTVWSTALAMPRRPVSLTTLFSWASWPKWLYTFACN